MPCPSTETRMPRSVRLDRRSDGLSALPILPIPGALVLCLTLTLVVGGCMTGPREWLRNGLKVGPNFCEPPAPVAEDWIDGESVELRPAAADYGCWWAAFNDATLNELVREAYRQNLPLKIAGMRILEARAQLGIASGRFFPQQQQAIGSFQRQALSENAYPFGEFPLPRWDFDNWGVGFDAAWELDFWGLFRRAIESADANLDAQIANYDDVLVILQGEIAATYIEARTLEQRLQLARENIAIQKNTLRISEDRFEQGVVSELDVHQARSNLAITESMIPLLEVQHRHARNRLCTLLAMPPHDMDARLGNTGKIPAALPEVAVGIPAELLGRRPDIRRAEREAAAQCAMIGVAESELYPHIAITGTIAVETERLTNLFESKSLAGSIGPGFKWNILNYWRLRNNIRVQDARFRQIVLGYQQTVLEASREVENTIVAYLREQDRVACLERSTAATAKAVELSNLQYDQGMISFQRVLDSQRVLVQQQENLAQSRGNVSRYLVAVYKALGGGWQMRLRSDEEGEMLTEETLTEELSVLDEQAPVEAPAAEMPRPEAPIEAPFDELPRPDDKASGRK